MKSKCFIINDFDKKIDLKVKMGLQALLDVAAGRLNPITAVIKRKIKIKGIYKIKTLLKFIKIFVTSMKMVMADPNINYYEIERNKR
ncbi:MAG: SCP2 sterol-binding domain-containing protein [Promethearchaeota archaeon]